MNGIQKVPDPNGTPISREGGIVMGLNEELASALKRLDTSPEPTNEHTIDSAVSALKPSSDSEWKPTPEYLAERFAFSFYERNAEGKDGDYTWFAPMTSGVAEDGTVVEYPSIKSITAEMLDYWTQRARQARHPVMRARYAGLVWEFSRKVTERPADIEMACMRIDAVVETANEERHDEPITIYKQLGQTLGLAISLNDPGRIEKVRDAIIAYEKKTRDDGKPRRWGGAWDLLLGNKKAKLTDAQEAVLIQDMEDRLERVSSPKEGDPIDPWAAEAAATRLAIWYRKKGKTEDVRRALLKVGRAFDPFCEKGNPLQAQAWHGRVEELYRRFGLQEEAAERRQEIAKLGPSAHDGLATYSQEISVTKEEMDLYVNDVLDGDKRTAIMRFIAKYLPRRQQTESELDAMAAKTPLVALATHLIMDWKGRPVGRIGSLVEDRDGRVVAATAQGIGMSGMFMRLVIEEMIRRFEIDAEAVMSWVRESPVFTEPFYGLLGQGLDAYFAGDTAVALHLLVPQVENAIRELAELVGCVVYRPNLLSGMDLRTLDDLLRDEKLGGALIPDMVEYLRTLYTDRRGINIRNKICHGMIPTEECGQGLADRVFHTVLLFATIPAKARDSSQSEEASD